MKVLLSGATGYLASHTAVELLASGHTVVGVDDFSESSPKTRRVIERLADAPMPLIEIDLRDGPRVSELVEDAGFDAIVHSSPPFPGPPTTLPARAQGQPLSSDPLCDGLEATIVGTNKDDILIGTEGPDVIVGGNGDDTIFGIGGDDVICGENGKDDLDGGDGDDRLFGGSGRDSMEAVRAMTK